MEEILMGSKGTRYKEEQMIGILKEVEGGASVAEVCRKYEVSEQTVYRWRSKYGGLDTSELQRLRELEAENSRLKKIVAQQVLDMDALKDLLAKKPCIAEFGIPPGEKLTFQVVPRHDQLVGLEWYSREKPILPFWRG